MIKEKKVINYNTVSKESKISKSFLYKNDGIRKKIDMLRNEQSKLKSVVNHKPNTSDKSKDIIIESLKFKIEQLEKENKDLKEALASKDRKSTRLNSSHVSISYAVFCLKNNKQCHRASQPDLDRRCRRGLSDLERHRAGPHAAGSRRTHDHCVVRRRSMGKHTRRACRYL